MQLETTRQLSQPQRGSRSKQEGRRAAIVTVPPTPPLQAREEVWEARGANPANNRWTSPGEEGNWARKSRCTRGGRVRHHLDRIPRLGP